jgi:hypothetical protein
MIKDNILLIGFIVGILLMVLIVNLTQCRKPAPKEPDPTEGIDSIQLRIDTIQITKIKTITKLKTKIQYETSIISRTPDNGQIIIRANLRDSIDFYLHTR